MTIVGNIVVCRLKDPWSNWEIGCCCPSRNVRIAGTIDGQRHQAAKTLTSADRSKEGGVDQRRPRWIQLAHKNGLSGIRCLKCSLSHRKVGRISYTGHIRISRAVNGQTVPPVPPQNRAAWYGAASAQVGGINQRCARSIQLSDKSCGIESIGIAVCRRLFIGCLKGALSYRKIG